MGEPVPPQKATVYRSLGEIAFQTLREAILNGSLKPGQQLVETELAKEMGISKTPIREAIRRLDSEGLIEVVPHRGAVVTGFSREDYVEIYAIRSTLEALAARLAAKNITAAEIAELKEIVAESERLIKQGEYAAALDANTRLHDIIYRASRNKRLVDLLNQIGEYVHAMRLKAFKIPGQAERSLHEHKEIVEALSNGDADRASDLIRLHIDRIGKAIEDSFARIDPSMRAFPPD